MSKEELAALEKDIKAELSALQAERLDLDEYDEIAALEKDILALATEFATVKAEKRRVQHPSDPTVEEQIAALQAQNRRLKEIRQAETEIEALQKQIKRLAGEIRLGRGATAGGPHRQTEMKRLAGEMAALIAKKRRLKLALRPRELERQPGHTRTKDEAGTPRMDIPVETVSLEALCNRDLIEDCGADSSVDERIESDLKDEKIESDLRDATASILKTLSPQEERVVRMRFGIGSDRVHTLEEIGQEFHLTRERIRQIETKALRQLRAPERARRLRAIMAAR